MTKFVSVISKVMLYAGEGLIAVAFVLAVLNPLTRVGTGATFSWTQTAAVWVTAFLAFFLAGVLILEEGHTKIELISNRIKGLPRKVLNCFNSLVVLLFVTLVFWGDIERMLFLKGQNMTKALGEFSFPFWIVFLCLSIGLFFLVGCCVIKVINNIRAPIRQTGDKEEF